MCRDTTSLKDDKDLEKKDDATSPISVDKNKNNNDKENKAPPTHYPWWCGGGAFPQNGTDMGVWERSLEDRANFWSSWSLSYLNPLLALGSVKALDAHDVGVPSDEDRAERAYQGAKAAWDQQVIKAEKQNDILREQQRVALDKCTTPEEREKCLQKEIKWKEPSMASSLVTSFGGWRITMALAFYIISALLSFGPVLILSDLVKYFEHYALFGKKVEYDGIAPPWALVAALGVIPVIMTGLQTQHQSIMAHCGVFVRTAVSTLLYQKSLRVSAAGRAKTSTGQVVNMMSNDTMQLQRFLQFVGLTMVAPVQIVVALFLIYQQVGNATWVGVGYMLFLAPINMFVFSIVSSMRQEVLKYADLRVKMMNEILTGIRIIKFYAWEAPFGKEVGRLRQKELDALTKLAYTTAVGFSIILLSTPIIQPILVFVTYVRIQDEPLSASTAFTTVALFNIMRLPFAFMPMGLLQYIQSKISLKRLERYLAMPELGSYIETTAAPPDDDNNDKAGAAATTTTTNGLSSGSVMIRNGTFSWTDPDGPEIKPIQDEKRKKRPSKRVSRRQQQQELQRDASNKSTTNPENNDPPNDNNNVDGTTRSLATSMVSEEGSKAGTPTITLQDISCTIQPGSLVAVVGPVGSGKSSFLSAILGEMEAINGSKIYIPKTDQEKEMHGFASYCTQSPWVVNDTLRGNILFGRELDPERYQEVLECCALEDDIAILPAGDMTEIGERGINLSGGQKARVALARAVYSKTTRLLLLDDPLSAVDAHVGEHIFSHAITGSISHGMTRILVTHHVHVLSRCDSVIIFDQGRIKHQGRYQDLIASGVDFAGAVDVSKIKSSQETGDNDKVEDTKRTTPTGTGSKDPMGPKKESTAQEKSQMKKAGETLVKEEEREKGQVAGDAYYRYARAGGLCVALSCIVIQGIGRGFEISTTFWLAIWAEDMLAASQAGTPFTDKEVSRYAGFYALLGIMGVVGLGFRGILLAKHRLHASKSIHDGITGTILRAPVAFFDVTPIGRVLNRFAADMDRLDLELTQTISQGISTIFNVLGAVVAIIVSTKGSFLVPLIPLGYMYYLVQKWFRRTSTELQRVTSVANSPIFADFSQTLSGTSTIRAYGVQNGFFEKCKKSFDDMNSSYILVQLVNYWLSLRLDIIGGLIAAFVGAVAVATLENGFIKAGWLGLSLSYSIEMTTYLKFGVQMIARMEADMSSVERILSYTDNIEPEAPDVIPDKDPSPGEWPTQGEIELSHASMRYRDGPMVLKDLSFNVKPGEKIGVCGRTGSGKSSLMIALFRISELENDEGKILIDGINTKEIGTSALRLNLSIIPQDPVMFSNTVRYNLDPFNTKSDEELWDVLKKVRLSEVIAALPKSLDEEVAEGGENFSQGQRQLLCIARSLLRKPKILVMDEATASIDNETDAAIQEMIRENFQDATVLTIAHRLNTIMDSDRILVLDDGRIVELDTPSNLIAKENGHFKAMVERSRAAHGTLD